MSRIRLSTTVDGNLLKELPARGEVWWCELTDIGRRPVVVLSRNAAIPRLRQSPSTVQVDLRPEA